MPCQQIQPGSAEAELCGGTDVTGQYCQRVALLVSPGAGPLAQQEWQRARRVQVLPVWCYHLVPFSIAVVLSERGSGLLT